MANYANHRGRYGGMVGSIIVHTTDTIVGGNDPSSANFKQVLPAGYLRCDGSKLQAKDFLALSRVLGVGDNSRFKKDDIQLRNEDVSTGDLGEFQLPDMGSKVIAGGRGTGAYSNDFIDTGLVGQTKVNRVGPQIEVISNFGDTISASYLGNVRIVPSGDVAFLGNPRYNLARNTTETELNIENFEGHAHTSNQRYLNYTGQHEIGYTGGKDLDAQTANSGSQNSAEYTSIGGRESIHKHSITRPTTYAHNFVYSYDQKDVDMTGVEAYVDVDISNDEKLDQLVTPFTLVEYLIKI